MKKKKRRIALIKLLIVVSMLVILIWFLVISPMITFHKYEEQIKDAAKDYYEYHSSELPIGERVKTLSLSALYDSGILKGNFYAPLSHKSCSIDNSWAKVKKENGHYIYYAYLDCGAMKSNIDHTGPVIKLNGKEKMTISLNDKYKEPGVDSVIDDNDGKIDTSLVTIKGDVDTSKVGSYTVKYTAYDSLKNKTEVIRTVEVVKYLSDYIAADIGDANYYKGEPTTNYVRFSNMYFRIVGFTEENDIILVAEEDVANVPYKKLEKWLDEVYMNSFTKEAKKLMVKHKFCKMTIKESDVKKVSKCTSYTKERYAYVPSIVDINRAQLPIIEEQYGRVFVVTSYNNFMKTYTMSWTADNQSSTKAYVNKEFFVPEEDGKEIVYYKDKSTYNYGVRPMIVVKGNVRISSGDGTRKNPYIFGNPDRARGGSLLNDRYTGEYIIIQGFKWVIIDTLDDGTTKVVSYDTLTDYGERLTTVSSPGKSGVYNPNDKSNMGYYINNKASKYIDLDHMVPHDIEVPIYKGNPSYGDEIKTVRYKVKLSPPNSYEMFSAQFNKRDSYNSHSYWLLNTSNSKNRYLGMISDTGCYINGKIDNYESIGIRVVGFIKKGTIITSGNGSYENPYKIK